MRLPKITFGKVLAGTGVVLLVATGGAYAANTIGSGDIINNSIKSKDVKDNALTGKDVKAESLKANDIKTGAVTSSEILDETILTTDVLDGSLLGTDLADSSVTSLQVLDGTLTSADVLDQTLTADDLASSSVGAEEIQTDGVQASEIQDNSIDAGEVIDFSLSNQDVGVLFAQVNANGTLANSSGGVSVIKLGGAGNYEVDFARNITSCAFVATVGPAGAGSALGEVNVADRGGNVEAVFVDTNNSAGAATDLPFSLLVVC